MEVFDKFYYNGYTFEKNGEEILVKYFFEIENLSAFTPTWIFPAAGRTIEELQQDAIFKKLVFSLGMVELISYWKLTCSKQVIVRPGKDAGFLDAEQLCWWKKLYFYGLGEFFYTNRIQTSLDDFMEIICEGGRITGQENPVEQNERFLVPVGGGKDSAVSIELLKKAGKDICAYVINPRGATVNTTTAAGFSEKQVFAVKRTLDKRMLELNEKGFLNGHTPFSALVAFSSTLTAYLQGICYIALSNEASANESTVKGSFVNHQYSKSFQFERDFHEYEEKYIGSGTYYFSLLRPLSEFQIARYFAKCSAYHDIFRSCNVGSKEDKWCGHCPKCLFVFLILSPFLPHGRLVEIFGADMVNDESMIPVMDQLTGIEDEKPFECVGSRDEVNMACSLTIAEYQKNGSKLPALYRHFMEQGLYVQDCNAANPFFTFYDENNLLPSELAELVRKNCCENRKEEGACLK